MASLGILLVFILLIGSIRAQQSTVLNATSDASVLSISSATSWNTGNSQTLILAGGSSVTHILVRFDFSSSLDNLESAHLLLSVRSFENDAVPCSPTRPDACGFVHVITNEWQEGSSTSGNTTEIGAVTWNHNQFPDLWTNPGGDFVSTAIGQQSPELSTNETAWFTMDVQQLQSMIDGNIPNFGFLIRNARGLGFVSYESRECRFGSNTTICPRRLPPQLSLSTVAPSLPPSGSPTLAPSVRDFQDTVFSCEDFLQEFVVPERLTFSGTQRFSDVFEDELEMLTPAYISMTEAITVVDISSFEQRDTSDSLAVQVVLAYSLCFEVPRSSDEARVVEAYAAEFERYMSIQLNRNSFEAELVDNGLSIQAGSLTAPAMASDSQSPRSPPGGGDDEDTSAATIGAIVGGVAAGVILILAVLYFVIRRRKQQEDGPVQKVKVPTHSVTRDTDLEPAEPVRHMAPDQRMSSEPPMAGHAVIQEAVAIAAPAWAEVPVPGDFRLEYKMQGQSVAHERTVQPQKKAPPAAQPYDDRKPSATSDRNRHHDESVESIDV